MAAVSGRGGMRLYVDAALIAQDPYTDGFADLDGDLRALLGRPTWDVNAPFRGRLDEVRLWSVARTADDIRADMDRALRGDEPGLRALWNFDAGEARGHGWDGVLRAGARCEAAPFPGESPPPGGTLVHGEVSDEKGMRVPNTAVRLTPRVGPALQTVTSARDTSAAWPSTGALP